MELVINRLPVKTWNRLHMNEVSIDVPNTDNEDVIENNFSGGEDVKLFPFAFDADKSYAGKVRINVESDVTAMAIMDFTSEENGYANVKSIIYLRNKSKLTLFQVHRLGEDFRLVNDVEAVGEEGSVFELIQIFISGGEIYAQAVEDLRGVGSRLRIDTAYLTTKDHILDINYVANHIGEKTVSDISASGTLCDSAEKRFRGTIDFKSGSVGAVGNEVERVLLLDDGVINKTIPIILCAEEDVEGNHGATIGRLDDETLYYMRSRGLDDETIRDMMRSAYVYALATRLPEGEYKDNLLKGLVG